MTVEKIDATFAKMKARIENCLDHFCLIFVYGFDNLQFSHLGEPSS